MTIKRGYILTSQLEQGNSGINIIYHGTCGNEPFKLIFENQKHVFFIPRASTVKSADFQFERKSGNLKSFNKDPVDAIYLSRLSDINRAKNFCERERIRTFEIDVSLTERFLMERFIFSEVEFQGEESPSGSYFNPQIRKVNSKTSLSQMAIDIETGVGGELYSIAYAYEYQNEKKSNVLMLAAETRPVHGELHFYATELELIQNFIKEFHALDPDIILGWHVIGFDLMFIEKKCQNLNIPLNLGRNLDEIKLDYRQGVGYFANCHGRIVLDGPPVLRGAFYQFANFKLETVASEVLGVGKDIASDENKVTEIERRFKEDKEALAKYNLLDCTLVNDIFNKLKLVELIKARTILTGLTMDRINVSTAAFDFIFLPLLHRKGFVASNRSDIDRDSSSSGGLVLTPEAGLHKDVMVFDFKSLYPSIIRTFNICPYALLQSEEDSIHTPEGFGFSKTESILPRILEQLFEERSKAKASGDLALSQAVKILMNSFYGIMGSTRSRFYHADLPQAITTTGHYLLNTAKEFFENRGLQVIYGDTDSLFVKGAENPEVLTEDLNSFLARLLKSEFKVESQLECEFEKKFDLIFFSTTRGGGEGAKKRYAGMIHGDLEFVGMEAVRSDWTVLAKEFQRNLFQRFFEGDDVESFIRSSITDLEAGKFDTKLIYTKRLSKPAHEYTKNVPVHVKAALKVDHKGPYPLREISYGITRSGPEPVQNGLKDFDYAHYIEKQVKPIADDVLVTLGKNFDSLRLGDQLSLF